MSRFLRSSVVAVVAIACAKTLPPTIHLTGPSTVVAGASFSATLTVVDASGKPATDFAGVISLSSSDPAATLPASDAYAKGTTSAMVAGVVFRTPGAQTITASAGGATAGTLSVTVSPAPARSIQLDAPQNVTAGKQFTFKVTIDNTLGAADTGYNGTIHFTSTDPAGQLPATYTFTPADVGEHAFTGVLATAGSIVLSVADGSGLMASQTIVVTAGAVASFQLNAPATTVAGAQFNVTATALDSNGNVVTGYTGTPTLAASDPKAIVPAPTEDSQSPGIVDFADVDLQTQGAVTLTVSDSSAMGQATVQVTNAPASALVVVVAPSPVACVATTLTVTATDPFGNTALDYRGTVHFSDAADPKAMLPATYAFTEADEGKHVFSGVVFAKAAMTSVTASDAADDVSGTTPVSVAAGVATAFSFAMLPAATTAGTSLPFTLAADDACGNVATSYTGTPTLSTTDSKAVLPAAHQFVSADQGADAYLGLVFGTVGAQTLKAADGAIKGSATLQVTNGPASTLTVSTDAAAVACIRDGIHVVVRDSYGNAALSYGGAIHFSSTDPGAKVPADYTFTLADQGNHDFAAGFVPKLAGASTLTVSDAADSLMGSLAITASAGATASLNLSGVPSTIIEGTPFGFTLGAADACGNATPAYRGTVAFTSTDSAATLPASYTFAATDAGAHTFALAVTFATIGTQTLTVKDVADNLSTSATVAVDPTGVIWVKQAGCTSCAVFPYQFGAFADDSVVVAGTWAGYSSPADPVFGTGEANQTTLTNPNDTGQIFVARYNADGTLAWAKGAGGSNDDHGNALRLLSDGTALVTGSVTTTIPEGSTDVVFGQGEPNQTAVNSPAGSVMYLARFNTSDGTLASVVTAGGTASPDYASGESIAVYPDDSFTACVSMQGDATFGAGEPNQTVLTTTTVESAMALAHYDSTGALVWARLFEGMVSTDNLGPWRCVELADGGLMAIGSFSGTAVFGATTVTSVGDDDAWIGRFDSSGNPTWIQTTGVATGSSYRYADMEALALESDGSVLVTGSFSSGAASGASITFGSTTLATASMNGAGFVARYGSDGTPMWAKLMDAPAMNDSVQASDMVLVNGTVVVLGRYSGGVTLGPGEPNQTMLTTSSSNDTENVFLAGLDPSSGALQWGHLAVTEAAGSYFQGTSYSLGARADGSLVMGGSYFGTGLFGPGDANATQLVGLGDNSAFIGAWWP